MDFNATNCRIDNSITRNRHWNKRPTLCNPCTIFLCGCHIKFLPRYSQGVLAHIPVHWQYFATSTLDTLILRNPRPDQCLSVWFRFKFAPSTFRFIFIFFRDHHVHPHVHILRWPYIVSFGCMDRPTFFCVGYTSVLAGAGTTAADLDSLGFVMCKLQHHNGGEAREEFKMRQRVGSEKRSFSAFYPHEDKCEITLKWILRLLLMLMLCFPWWRLLLSVAAVGSDGVTFAHFAFHFLGWRFLLGWVEGDSFSAFFTLMSAEMLSSSHANLGYVRFPFRESFVSERINNVINI